jgi:hypothetical protein
MRGAILPLPQYAFMAWCSVKRKAQGQLYLIFAMIGTECANVLWKECCLLLRSTCFYYEVMETDGLHRVKNIGVVLVCFYVGVVLAFIQKNLGKTRNIRISVSGFHSEYESVSLIRVMV